MNCVLIVSDSHGLTTELVEIKNRHQTENIIHCGDSELNTEHEALKDMHVVRGNCDFDYKMSYTKNINISGFNFFVTHGHLYQVGRDLTTLARRAAKENAQIICYGHTHMARVEKIGQQLLVNPGSIRSPRDRVERTYAIIKFDDLNEVYVTFYTIEGKVLNDLSVVTRLK